MRTEIRKASGGHGVSEARDSRQGGLYVQKTQSERKIWETGSVAGAENKGERYRRYRMLAEGEGARACLGPHSGESS